jgi:hypothetical protein
MTEFDNAANRPPWTDAAHVRARSKSSNGQKRQFRWTLWVMGPTLMMRYGPFELPLVCHKGVCCGEGVTSTERANGDDDD